MTPNKRAIDKVYKRRDRYEIPDWQRVEVWDTAKKQKLIDTILRGWKLPKFYLLKTGRDEYEVVDGQQRINAIIDFFGNELALSEESTTKFGGPLYKDLDPNISDAFDDYEIEFDEIEDASDSEIKEFFQRLQEGLPLTSSEKLNSVHSKLRDYVRELSKHNFFKNKVYVADTRYAHFDIVSKVATLEIEDISTGLRYDDLRAVFEANSHFSSASSAGKRLKSGLDMMDVIFQEKSPLLKNRTIVQSFSTLIIRLAATGKAKGHEGTIKAFFGEFMRGLAEQMELGQKATDADFIGFQKTISANVRSGAGTRQAILFRKLFEYSPVFATFFDASVIKESGISSQVAELGENMSDYISRLNAVYSAKHGDDLFKATNKTTQAQLNVRKPVDDLNSYTGFIDELYFLFRESIGQRLVDNIPRAFSDVNVLRTDLQHDIDHGDAGKVRAKRKKTSEVFKKYSSQTSPHALAPEMFPVVQVGLMRAINFDLEQLLKNAP
ncbi:MAG: DUF262 domain-containing protein [Hymenobacteraceae bacterium]|nr:DUF262 domain-containing protein [Hymenobacteraceae bacterium]